ncbi:TolC family protein [Mucilaginibacter achroorhodeus]|uniref:TolC family protein n=1 Tax=Mucilaginibacter achroorhodeus TaxID=2599294 RepID=A0A563TZH6_9SPHI|nr:TolC family protein [Mucilaginibacter achroorhodeus]TWR24152.1 TolC family protein [Mucilaginibacter achroorhodeus]
MFSIKKCWLLLYMLPATVCAQNNKSIGLNALLDKVNNNAPALIADAAAIKVKQAQASDIKSNWLPSLNLNYQADVGTNNNVAGPYFAFGIVPSNSRGVRTESNTSATLVNLGIAALDWEVYNFGAYGAANKAAAADVDVEQRQFEQSKYALTAATIDNYLQLGLLQNLLTIQERNIKRNQEIRRSIQALARSGIRAGVDTSIAEAEISKSRLTYIDLLNQAKQIQIKLSAVSGIPANDIVADTTTQQSLARNAAEFSLFNADTLNHPIINYYRSIYNSSLQKENLVRKSYSPKIMLEAAAWGRAASVDANDHFGPLGNGWGFDRGNYLVGVGVSYNLFNVNKRRLKLNTQKASTLYAEKKLQEQKALIAAGSSQADANVASALDRLQEIPKQLKAANAAYRQKFALYKNGLTDIIELNAALNLLYRAETDYTSAKFSYSRALFQKAVVENQVDAILKLL